MKREINYVYLREDGDDGRRGTSGSVILPGDVITEDIDGQRGASGPVILPEVIERIRVHTMESASESSKDKDVTSGKTAAARVRKSHSDILLFREQERA